MAGTGERIIEMEFSADLAGERVGWISVDERETSRIVTVATATVGADGAKIEGWRYDGGQLGYASGNDGGFEDASVVTFAVIDSEVRPQGIDRYVPYKKGDSGSCIRDGGRSFEGRKKAWAVGSQALVGTIKDTLAEQQLAAVYPYAYYNLNALAGVYLEGSYRIDRREDISPLLLADPSMHEMTAAQIATAEGIVESLTAVKTEDATMRQNLTVFSSVTSEDLPSVFEQSRQNVTGLEHRISETAHSLFAQTAMFVPVGQGPTHRTWPYMDPLAKTNDEAYGRELKALHERNVAPAYYELEHEIAELDGRIARVSAGLRVLNILNELELTTEY